MTENRNAWAFCVPVLTGFLLTLSACSSNLPTANSTKAPTLLPTTAIPEPTSVTTSQTTVAVATSAEVTTVVSAATSNATAVAGATTACTLLNLNTSTGDQYLKTIPGFSDRMVREFLEYRPYASIRTFRKEIGKYVDPVQVAEWEKYVFVPIDPNNADVETLKQIPGVTDDVATKLISERSYASNQAFLDALGKLVTPDQLASATCYIAS